MILHAHATAHQYTAFFLFFFNDTATTEIYTLSLHDALPILRALRRDRRRNARHPFAADTRVRSEEHTSELQSRSDLVCRLLLEKNIKRYTQRARLYVEPARGGERWHIPHASI